MQNPPARPFKDRSARLTLFGALSILGGCGGLLLGLLHVLLLIGARHVPGLETMPVDARATVMGALLYALLGGSLVWVGLGSLRKRRWARPLMLTLAWSWLLGGITVLPMLPGLVDLILAAPVPGAQPSDPIVAGLVKAFLMVVAAVFGLVVPALFVWAYHDRHVQLTCEAHDPEPSWTERCPPVVLGLSVGLGACGVLTLLMVLRPAVPLFGRLVTGRAGALWSVAGAGVCFWLARQIYALRRVGWWSATGLMVLVGASTWLTLVRVESAELLRAMGYPADSLPAAGQTYGLAASWLTVVLTLLSVAYMVGIRKHFRQDADDPVSRPS
jgi:hypothetical protein